MALKHVALAVSDRKRSADFYGRRCREDVAAAREALRQGGVEEDEWRESGPTAAQAFDPDGYRVELYAY